MRRDIIDLIAIELGLLVNRDEIKEIEEELAGGDYEDFHAEIDGEEYRFIHEDFIWDIYKDTIKEIAEDCYDLKLPKWLAVNWEETAENCYQDGFGHTFSTYDGSEREYMIGNILYYIFRTN